MIDLIFHYRCKYQYLSVPVFAALILYWSVLRSVHLPSHSLDKLSRWQIDCLFVYLSVCLSVCLYWFPQSHTTWSKYTFLYLANIVWRGIMESRWLSICPSICPSSVVPPFFRFWTITWVNFNGFPPNLVCALILWRSGLGLLMGKFHQFLTELSVHDRFIFSFPDDNLKFQWIFTKRCVHWYCGALLWDCW